MNKEEAASNVNKAIDGMVELQDGGFGCVEVLRIVDQLNSLRTAFNEGMLDDMGG